ncbi:MAG: ATP-binding protein [Acidimicrobiaceae bacterium]|nr:ATP-binding protein [Acidimicrobiaceae bacterium]MYC41339.1 ATP-binding protein [Acidimicrobiaceae bacterium]MYH89177.1 ATP-binding protein [Acidimicrobiaceae bacterium]
METLMRPEPLSDVRLRALVEEIRDGSIAVETDWLEWKRSLDLSDAKSRFPVPKNVLGMANRMPETALRSRGGYGYILLGVGSGSILGVDHVDPAQLHDWIDPYIGSTGPEWQFRCVTVGDKTVAAIEVAPPRPGDRIHTLRKECDRFQRGTIFVRKNGKTHRADDQDVENLVQRAKGARLDLGLLLIGEERIGWFKGTAVQAEIKQAADRLRESQLEHARDYSKRGEPDITLAHTLRRATTAAYAEERRSLDDYESEVDEWHAEWTKHALQHWIENYMLAGHGVIFLRLENLTDQNFAGVQVRLHIEGVQVEDDIPLEAVELPKQPKPFGKGTGLFDIGHIDMAIPMRRVDFATSFDPPEFSVIQLDGAVEVVWNAGHLRPVESVDSTKLCILLDAPQDLDHLSIAWSATSTGVNGLFESVLEIPFAKHPTLLDDVEHHLHS